MTTVRTVNLIFCISLEFDANMGNIFSETKSHNPLSYYRNTKIFSIREICTDVIYEILTGVVSDSRVFLDREIVENQGFQDHIPSFEGLKAEEGVVDASKTSGCHKDYGI